VTRGVVEAARGLDNAADDHPQAARRFAPHNQRMQQSIPSASKLASGLAADPQHSPLAPLGGRASIRLEL